jgi:hypothetical protein
VATIVPGLSATANERHLHRIEHFWVQVVGAVTPSSTRPPKRIPGLVRERRGQDDHLVKPLDLDALMRVLASLRMSEDKAKTIR